MGGNWKKKNQTIKTTKRGFIDQSKLGGIKYSWDLQKKIRLENDLELLKLILPELLLEHYHLVNTKSSRENASLLEEKNTPPKEYNNRQLIKRIAKWNYYTWFSTRGKFVYLHIKDWDGRIEFK
jgi:hypothetical protein